jgi:hypothetical protein
MHDEFLDYFREYYFDPALRFIDFDVSWVPNLPPIVYAFFNHIRLQVLADYLLSLLPPTFSVSLAPILALADFTLISLRTIQTGTSSVLDAWVLCPGLHKQSAASTLHEGEYPATAALTTGYVFRTENQAMVHFLQRVGVTGSLVTLSVKEYEPLSPTLEFLFGPGGIDASHVIAVVLTTNVLDACKSIGDSWARACLYMMIASRVLNIIAIRRRLAPEWHGAREAGVRGDLLVLLSQDRWIRIQGLVDDLKAVTSGQWLRDQTWMEQCLVDSGTFLVYAAVVVGSNASQKGAVMIAALLLTSSVLLGISNLIGGRKLSKFWRGGRRFWMHGRVVEVVGEPKKYKRRRILADELIEETGRDDWAVQMGMIPGKEKGGLAIM